MTNQKKINYQSIITKKKNPLSNHPTTKKNVIINQIQVTREFELKEEFFIFHEPNRFI